ncbi:MAG: histidinol-phosphate transaminase [bacterium]
MLHGGELKNISDKYNIPQDSIIDFSGNICPVSIIEDIREDIIKNLDVINRYPDVNYSKLRESIGNYCNIKNIDNIIAGNGATEIISLLIKAISPKKSLLVAPVYSEYKKELKSLNSEIIEYELKEEENFELNIRKLLEINSINNDIELAILCNPNNPTGNAININQIEELLNNFKFLMIDETYVEFSNSNITAMSLINKYDNLFIIRGVSKFFGIPGVRLGYGVCGNQGLVDRINLNKELWSVNSYADLIGQLAFNNKDYINQTRRLILTERDYIKKELAEIKSLKIYESEANFILCKILRDKLNSKGKSNNNSKINSTEIFEKLIKQNILIRDAKNFEFLDDSYFRFCILSHENNKLLLENLRKVLI